MQERIANGFEAGRGVGRVALRIVRGKIWRDKRKRAS